MKIHKKLLAATAALVLAPFAASAQDAAPVGAASRAVTLDNFRWSVHAVYAHPFEKKQEGGYTLYGAAAELSCYLTENKEVFSEISYLTGSEKDTGAKYEQHRVNASAGYRYWFPLNQEWDAWVGGKLGITSLEFTNKTNDYGMGPVINFTGAVGAGLVYKLKDYENARLRIGVDYSTDLGELYDSYRSEDGHGYAHTQEYLMVSVGLEFKF